MNELESRFVDQWCALFGQFIRVHLDSGHGGPLDCLQLRLGDMADIATAEVHRAFIGEVLHRIAEIAPDVSRRIEARFLARRMFSSVGLVEGEGRECMGDFDFKSRFLTGWCSIFSQLLEAQLNDSESGDISKLRARYQNLAEISGPEVTQEFFHEVISRTGEVAPEAAERLLRNLSASGVLKKRFCWEAVDAPDLAGCRVAINLIVDGG